MIKMFTESLANISYTFLLQQLQSWEQIPLQILWFLYFKTYFQNMINSSYKSHRELSSREQMDSALVRKYTLPLFSI